MKKLSLLIMAIVATFYLSEAQTQTTKPAPKKPAVTNPDGINTSLVSAPQKITTVEGITEYRLGNGLKVLMFPDNSKQSMTVNITYMVGSGSEGYGETGMAHLLEHMLFKGSTKHPNIPDEFKTKGAQFNGTTWYDRTNYYEIFPASEDNLKWALDLESDRMVNSFIKKADLDKEMTVVRNEFEMGENSPESILMERVMSTAFLWHNYGKSTIGNRSDIENVPIQNLHAFYQKYYQPDNAMLLIGGKIDEAKALALVNEYFGAIPKPTRKLPVSYTVEPTQDGERNVTLRRVGDVQVVSCGYHIPSNSDPDFEVIDVLTELLTNSNSGRLQKALIETKLASSQYGYAFGLREPGFVYFNVSVRKENSLDDAKTALLKTLDELTTIPPTDEEVDRAKSKLLNGYELFMTNSEQLGVAMSDFAASGDWRLMYLSRDRLRKVTKEDVKRVAAKYIISSNRTVGLFIPEQNSVRAEIPAQTNIDSLLQGYKGEKNMAQGESFDPTNENIEKRLVRGEVPNSVKYALLSKTTRGNTVEGQIVLYYGDVNSLKNKAMASQYAASLLMKGSASLTKQQIEDSITHMKAEVRIGGGNDATVINIKTKRDNLVNVIKLVASIVKTPAYNEKEFNEMKQEELAGIEQNKSDPMAIAGLELERLTSPYTKEDVRYSMSFDEQIAAINALSLDQVKDFYKTFYGGTYSTSAFVGDYDVEQVKSVLTEEFGNWKSASPHTRLVEIYKETPGQEKSFNTPDKANAMFLCAHPIAMQDNDADYAALFIGNYIFGGGALSSRLADRIRQKDGLSYGVGSFFQASKFEKDASLGAYAICAPENTDKVEAAFKEELQRILKEGITQEELDKAREGWLQSRKVGRGNNGSMAGKLEDYIVANRTFQWDADFEKQIKSLAIADVNKALVKYVKPEKFTYIKAGDFTKK